MPDYQNSRIYKIVNLETNECYIGSTTLALSQRLAQHVRSYKCWLNGKGGYMTSFKIIEQDDYDIVLIEKFPCNNKEELHARESHYCQSQGLFIKIGRIEYDKQYNVDHKDRKKEYFKQYNEQRKDQSKQYYIENIDKIKEYRERHKDQSKEYREQHREQIKHRANTVLICFCGCSYTRCHKTHHEQTNKHKEYVENRLYYDIQRGLIMIKKLDAHFLNKYQKI
jgi:hypothetical protein